MCTFLTIVKKTFLIILVQRFTIHASVSVLNPRYCLRKYKFSYRTVRYMVANCLRMFNSLALEVFICNPFICYLPTNNNLISYPPDLFCAKIILPNFISTNNLFYSLIISIISSCEVNDKLWNLNIIVKTMNFNIILHNNYNIYFVGYVIICALTNQYFTLCLGLYTYCLFLFMSRTNLHTNIFFGDVFLATFKYLKLGIYFWDNQLFIPTDSVCYIYYSAYTESCFGVGIFIFNNG